MSARRMNLRQGVFRCLLCAVCCALCAVPKGFAQTVPAAGSAPNLAPGQKISLDLKGVDILDVLKLLSQKSGLNFVAGRNVAGRVTIFAKEVDLWETFERIVDSNELAYEMQGGLINVMTAREYELLYGQKFQERKRTRAITLKYAKANQMATVLNQLKSSVGQIVVDEASNTVILTDLPSRLDEIQGFVAKLDRPTETRIYNLNYAEADKLKEKIQEFLTPGVGTFSFDARTNKVIVTDMTEAIQTIDQLIRALDEPEGEVLIEAKIVKVDLTDAHNFGIDWQRVFAGIDTKVRSNFKVLTSDVVEGTGNPGNVGGALRFLAGPRSNAQIVLEALQTYGRVETISNPRIVVSNNKEAKILVGKKEAVVSVTTTVTATGSPVSAPTITYVDVGTKLFVTPSVKRDGQVQLKIRPEVSTADVQTFQGNRIPIVSTTEAETNVLVKSGTTVIIGGLIDSKLDHSESRLPGAGELPLIGAAFRNRANTDKKTELVVFLTPQIISTSGQQVKDFSFPPLMEQVTGQDQPAPAPVPAAYQAVVRDLVTTQLTQGLRATSLGDGSLIVSFLLAQDGRLIGEPEISSPQGEAFVRAARAALASSVPFPPFPKDTPARQVRFRVAVDYRPSA